jgi:hypothetical protein
MGSAKTMGNLPDPSAGRQTTRNIFRAGSRTKAALPLALVVVAVMPLN